MGGDFGAILRPKWVVFDKSNVNIGDIIPIAISKIKGITLHGKVANIQEMEAA